MSLLDWIARKQNKALEATGTLRSVESTVRSMEQKVANASIEQIRISSFDSVRQRDSLVMQRVLGQQPARADK